MSEHANADGEEWQTHCPTCNTEKASAVVDFDKSNADTPGLRAGEMVAVDYCPNPRCPSNQADREIVPGSPEGDSNPSDRR